MDPQKAAIDLFTQFFNFLLTEVKANEIFVHNLGSFYGYFIYKYATLIYEPSELKTSPIEGTNNTEFSLEGGEVSCVIDDQSRFIFIKVLTKKFIDSCRIFPVSLNELCDVFNKGVGKTRPWDSKFDTINVLSDPALFSEFIDYATNDSVILYNCMLHASITYKEDYDVQLSSIVSISSLSLMIYRKQFMPQEIPFLFPSQDDFVRESYHGGATDFYQRDAKNLYCYDKVTFHSGFSNGFKICTSTFSKTCNISCIFNTFKNTVFP